MKQATTNLFVFWLGNMNQFDYKKYEKKHFNLIVGPTAEDHKFLLEKYPYYRYGFEAKRFSFCSDVWRLFMLSKNRGLYVDVSVEIGSKVESFVRNVEKYDAVAFRGNYKYVESGVLWSGKENNTFYSNLLKFYENDLSISSFVMPVFLSVQFWKLGFSFGWDAEEINNIKLLPLTEIRNKNTLWKTSAASWTKEANFDYFGKIQKNDGWLNWEKKYRNGIEDTLWSERVERAMNGATVDVTMIRMFFDKNIMRDKMRRDYKKINYKIKFSERLIWSKLYSFFARNL